MSRIPNLFGSGSTTRSRWYYERFLSRLLHAGRARRMIEACRQIRRYAAAGTTKKAAMFTYHWEMEAFESLGDFDSMWRALRAGEQAALKKRLNLANHRWKPRDFQQLIYFYAPLLYLRGEYQLGHKLLERALRMAARRKGWSYEMLWHIYKPSARPSKPAQVTLSHFYRALGRDLTDWELWSSFVNDLHPKLLEMSGVSRAALKKDAALIKPLFQKIVQERKKRLTSGVTHGLRDITDPPAVVRERQRETKKKIGRFLQDPKHAEMDRELEAIFPELIDLSASRRR